MSDHFRINNLFWPKKILTHPPTKGGGVMVPKKWFDLFSRHFRPFLSQKFAGQKFFAFVLSSCMLRTNIEEQTFCGYWYHAKHPSTAPVLSWSPRVFAFAKLTFIDLQYITFTTFLLSADSALLDRVAEVGSLSATAIIAKQIFVCRVFVISSTNASFLRIIANLHILFSVKCNIYHVIVHFMNKKNYFWPKKYLFSLESSKNCVNRDRS